MPCVEITKTLTPELKATIMTPKNVERMQQANAVVVDKPTCVIMCGLPGSGKDYWINNFIKGSDKDWVVVSTDMHIESYAEVHGINYSAAFDIMVDSQPMYKYAEKLMNADIDRYSRASRNIIWNQTNMARSKRDKIRRRLGNKYDFLVKYMEVPDDVLVHRLITRGGETGKFIPWSVVENMLKTFVPVTPDENLIVEE